MCLFHNLNYNHKIRHLEMSNKIRFLYNVSRYYTNFRNMSVEESIRKKLTENLKTVHLEIINESYMHNVPKGSETHFKVVVVSDLFKDIPLIKRHRMVNSVLEEELKNGVHALSIIAKTCEQWEASDKNVEPSPNCKGGFGK